MELLIAFLMSFGVISADDAKHIKSSDEIKEIMMKSDLKDDLKNTLSSNELENQKNMNSQTPAQPKKVKANVNAQNNTGKKVQMKNPGTQSQNFADEYS